MKLAMRVLTAQCGLRLLLTSSVPRGGTVHRDQCLDISQVEYTSGVSSGLSTVVCALHHALFLKCMSSHVQ